MRAWLTFSRVPPPPNPFSFVVNDNPAVLLVNAAAIIQLPNHMVWMLVIFIIIIKAGSSTGTSLEVGTLDTLHMQGVGLGSKQKQRALVLGASAVFDQREYLLLLLVLIRDPCIGPCPLFFSFCLGELPRLRLTVACVNLLAGFHALQPFEAVPFPCDHADETRRDNDSLVSRDLFLFPLC